MLISELLTRVEEFDWASPCDIDKQAEGDALASLSILTMLGRQVNISFEEYVDEVRKTNEMPELQERNNTIMAEPGLTWISAYLLMIEMLQRRGPEELDLAIFIMVNPAIERRDWKTLKNKAVYAMKSIMHTGDCLVCIPCDTRIPSDTFDPEACRGCNDFETCKKMQMEIN